MIQIRNVPDDIHRKAKARAALAGMTMSEYILQELRKVLERPTRDELLVRIAELPPIEVAPGAADMVREERDAR
jgi:plasmid stability protein